MNKKTVIYVVLTLIVVAALVTCVALIHRDAKPKHAVLFYSEACPHCQTVENYIDANQVMTRLNLEKKQVNTNIEAVIAVAQSCHLDLQRLQIPLLWTGKRCIFGDKPVIQYFKKQLSKQ